MSENAKTITFVLVGLAAIVVGLVTRPSSAELDETTLVGQTLNDDFSGEDAKRLRIVQFNEDTATLRDFEVAESDGLWTIPSKDGYPADAAQQMGEAATSLMDRKILQVASTSSADHEQFGVIDPTSPKLQPGQKGVGTRVTMSDAQNKPLVDMIVGKAVKGADGQRYVREAGRAVVYVIEIDRSKLSTDFADWIEKDLLKLNAWDLQQVDIKDYSASLVRVMTQQGPDIGIDMDQRAEMTLAYNDTDSKWTPVKLRAFDATKGQQGEYVDFTLAEGEELNAENLNGLKTALDDLQIVDVVKKPAGLGQDLKASKEFVTNEQAVFDLMSKGFTPKATAPGQPEEIISSDGEVVATMKNGVEYVLRFGNLASSDGSGEEGAEQPADPAAAAAEAKKSGSEVNRYLFVMARMNKDAIKKPELADLPELPAGAEKQADEAKGEVAAKAEDATKNEDAAAAPAEGETPAAADAAKPAEGENKDEAARADEAAKDEAATEDAAKKDAATEDNAAKKDDAAAADSAKKDSAAAPAEKNEEVEKIIAERKRIEAENQRKLDEYNDMIKKGEEQMKELNLRFGDWYFVVDDDVFKKIRLGRDEVIKKKEAPKAEGAAEGAAPPAAPSVPGVPAIPGASE